MFENIFSQLLAMDASARRSMKDAAKCDKLCEWQNFENQQNAERILHFQVIPESISASGRLYNSALRIATSFAFYCAFLCVTAAFSRR